MPSDERPPPSRRASFPRFDRVDTRWMDNDLYGHVNNVVYYSYFDTVINRFLIAEGSLDIVHGDAIDVVASSACRYHAPLAFPESIDAGLRVAKLGASSVHWEIGLFAKGAPTAAADGTFVHVFVDRGSRKPVPIPALVRVALARLMTPLRRHGHAGRVGSFGAQPLLASNFCTRGLAR